MENDCAMRTMRVVDRGVAMRVVFAHHVADHAGRFAIGLVRRVAGLLHGEQDAPMHRLQPVARVRQGAADDDRHRVVEVGAAHLLLRASPAACPWGCRTSEGGVPEGGSWGVSLTSVLAGWRGAGWRGAGWRGPPGGAGERFGWAVPAGPAAARAARARRHAGLRAVGGS